MKENSTHLLAKWLSEPPNVSIYVIQSYFIGHFTALGKTLPSQNTF